MSRMQKVEMLSREEETRLFHEYMEHGSLKARDRILLCYRPLAIRMARSFAAKSSRDIEDLCQEAVLALARAIDRFDPEKNTRLSTLANFYIGAALMRYSMETEGPVRIGTNVSDRKTFFGLRRIFGSIQSAQSDPITEDQRAEIAEKLGVSLKHMKRMEQRLFASDMSLSQFDAPDDQDTAPRRLPDVLVHDDDVESGLLAEDQARMIDVIRRIVQENFSGRDLEIVEARLDGPMTRDRFQALASKHDITVERIRQIQRAALRLIREKLIDQGIERSDVLSAD